MTKEGTPFTRELRYVVVKCSDAVKYLTSQERGALEVISAKCQMRRIDDRKKLLETVVVESDWPEYEPTWKSIEERVPPTPPTPAGAGRETPSREFSSNPHDHGMVPDTFSPPGFTSWRLRTNEEWVALTEALRRQAEADRATKQAELDHRIAINAALNKTDARGNDEIEQIEWLATQLATADKDRERLDWLEKNRAEIDTDGPGFVIYTATKSLGNGASGMHRTLRAAIDAALQPSPSLDHGATGEMPL